MFCNFFLRRMGQPMFTAPGEAVNTYIDCQKSTETNYKTVMKLQNITPYYYWLY